MQIISDRDIDLKFILEGCLKGNRNSQRKLYEHYYGYAMNVCLRYSKDREEAVEILNDSFLKAFVNLDKYNSEYPFKAWFRRILINTAIDHYRVNVKVPSHLDLLESTDSETEEMSMPEISPGEDMLPVLQKLSPVYRMVFNLFVMEEYNHQEIAEILGINESTSRSNLVGAKNKLREMLSPKNIRVNNNI